MKQEDLEERLNKELIMEEVAGKLLRRALKSIEDKKDLTKNEKSLVKDIKEFLDKTHWGILP